MTTVSLHLANTYSGEYDVRWPLPKPLHCDSRTGRITRPADGRTFTQVVGFVEDPDEETLDLTWDEWATDSRAHRDRFDPDLVEGLFPVVVDGGRFATLTLPVRGVSLDGKPIGRLEVE